MSNRPHGSTATVGGGQKHIPAKTLKELKAKLAADKKAQDRLWARGNRPRPA